MTDRNHTITLLKAFAIILVVMAHAGSPVYLSRFSYMIGVSLFFMASGYFFKEKYLTDEATFVKRRLKGLYIPFVKWSIILLILHNLWFYTGILNETYGNASGGVTHPLSAHAWMQSLWSIVTNMSGYDMFLGGAFWCFRSLLVASIVFLIGFKCLSLLPIFGYEKQEEALEEAEKPSLSASSKIALTLATIALGLALWMTSEKLRWTGMSQGGYRELMGVFFLSTGFLYHRFCLWGVQTKRPKLLPFWASKTTTGGLKWAARAKCHGLQMIHALVAFLQSSVWTLCHIPLVSLLMSMLILILFTSTLHPSMTVRAHSLTEVFALAASGIVGFSFARNLAMYANLIGRHANSEDEKREAGIAQELQQALRKTLLYIGDHTLYIFAWHLLSFKLVSILKVLVYGLPWEMVGGHPVVHSEEGQWFWVLYSIVGIALPCLGIWGYRKCLERFGEYLNLASVGQFGMAGMVVLFTLFVKGCKILLRWSIVSARWTGRAIVVAARFTKKAFIWFFGGFFRWIVSFGKSFIDTIKDGSHVEQDE